MTKRMEEIEKIDTIVKRFWELDDDLKLKFLLKCCNDNINGLADCVFNDTFRIYDMKDHDENMIAFTLEHLEEAHIVIDEEVERLLLK